MLDTLPEGLLMGGPTAYARHLATYISNPSTIRARTLEEFGEAPPLHKIENWRQMHLARHKDIIRERDVDKTPFRCGHPRSAENMHLAEHGEYVCDTCRQTRLAKIEAEKRAKRIERWEAFKRREAQLIRDAQKAKIAAQMKAGEAISRSHGVTSIISTIAETMGSNYDEVTAKGRSGKRVTAVKGVIIAALRARGLSFPGIGRHLGRDHSTVIYCYRCFERDATPEMRTLAEAFAL